MIENGNPLKPMVLAPPLVCSIHTMAFGLCLISPVNKIPGVDNNKSAPSSKISKESYWCLLIFSVINK